MLERHCQGCGGLIGNPAGTRYREASTATPPVAMYRIRSVALNQW
jgi:hypothetical protein